jgi:nucleotide-binding universal stress UspA family protein
MAKKDRIIVLIDLSDYSENLIRFAFDFAILVKAEVVFLHQILGMVPAIADNESRNEIIKIEKATALASLKVMAQGRSLGVSKFIVSQESILSLLKELASDDYTDWVFSGLKGTGFFKRILLGSTTLAIINESNCLSVAIPVHEPLLIPRKLVVGVTHKYPINNDQLKKVIASLTGQIASIEFFTFLQDSEDEAMELENLNKLQSEFSEHHSSVFLSKGENRLAILKEHIAKSEHPFLVLQQGSRTLEDLLFRKFTVNELVYSGQIPLIILSK